MTLSSRKLFLLPFLSVFITINPPVFAETPESKIKALNQKLQIAKSDSMRVYTLFMLSQEYSMSNITEAINYSEQAYELALRTGDSELVSAALLNMGTAYQGQGLYEIAIRHYETYLEIQRKAKKDKEAEL
jgi:tetratricopeptide (TPR) repeat protein